MKPVPLLLLLAALALMVPPSHAGPQVKRPNLLWISAEDLSPDLGCYGDAYAVTPNIDRLASQGVRYTRAFSNSPVCAPSRSALITGMYCTTLGTQFMRCKGVPPPEVRCFPEYLRAAGYYCTNNVKTDYQFDPPFTAWDESSNRAHWRGRRPDQPFFAVFNINTSHESQIRNHTPAMQRRIEALGADKHDPAKAMLPPYYPDTPRVRKDWAQYYDVMTLMDREAGEILKQLEEDGLAEDTIVWFWGDHGRGLPRGKRWPYDSGLRVPLIVRAPEKWRRWVSPRAPEAVKPGTVNGEMVSFVDFAPTMLSLAKVERPKHLQGRAFLGESSDPPRRYCFGNRDRMDEAYDLIRTVRDSRYRYLRHFMPHLPVSQNINYMDEMPTMQEMRRLYAEGKLAGPQLQYFRQTKPIEELYDLETDPHEVINLAADAKHRDTLARLREALDQWMAETHDLGLIPEPEFDEMKRPGGVMDRTREVRGSVTSPDGTSSLRIQLESDTPGASIGYQLGNGQRGWQLYTAPFLVEPGTAVQAKACRIGFQDSEPVTVGDMRATLPRPGPREPFSPWWTRLAEGDLIGRLRALKALDGQGAKAVPAYLKALDDPAASVRYWAVIGLQHDGRGQRTRDAVADMLRDPSPVVRIAAARALCDWGGDKQALPVLIAGLRQTQGSARLHAAIALEQIGEKARPAIEALRAAKTDPFEYVQRVSERTLRKLTPP